MSASGSFVDITTAKQAGVLSRLTLEFAKAGLTILKQKIEPLSPERQQIRFQFAQGSTVSPELRNRLGSVPGVEKVGRMVEAKPSDQELQELLRDAYQEIVGEKDGIIEAVVAFGGSLPTETRDACLISLGRKIGNRIYQERYSLGSPLELRSALDRIVAPELKEFGPVRTRRGDQFELDNCPFCRNHDSEPSCAYLSGLARGLLELAPPTSNIRVSETACAHERPGSPCVFTITP